MPSINPAVVSQISGGVIGRFIAGLDLVQSFYPRVSEVIPSSKAFEIYPFVGDSPELEEWVGARQIKELKAYEWTIRNKHYEATIKVSKDQVADNDVAGLYPQAERLGRAAAMHPDKLLATLIEAGFTTLCYDGQYFFDTDHPTGQSNKGTTALSDTSYAAARAAMGNFVNDAGRKLGVVPDVLMVPPALEGVGRRILNAEYVAESNAGVTNVWRGSADLLVNPWLTDATNWYLFATKQLMPALVTQMRQSPELVPKVNMSDDNVFFLNELIWGVDYRGNVGYGHWACAFGALVAG